MRASFLSLLILSALFLLAPNTASWAQDSGTQDTGTQNTGAQAPESMRGGPDFGECEEAVDDATLREEVRSGAQSTMAAALSRIDFTDLVERAWGQVRFDSKFTALVDAKIAVLREDRSYVERLLDGNIPSRAEEVAQITADAVFASPEFETLQAELQSEIGARLQPLVADADAATRSQAAQCIAHFLGTRYALTVQQAFATEASEAQIGARVQTGSAQTAAGISMAGVVAAILAVVFRRLIRRIVRSVVQRLAGAIAARLASWVSGIVGAVLLAYELITGADGVFPIIREELLSAETRNEMQGALIEELGHIGPEQLEERAEAIAAEMFERWRAFRDDHHTVLALAERYPRFKTFTEEQGSWRFEALTAVTGALQRTGGEARVLDALDRGVLLAALRVPDIQRQLDEWQPAGLSVEDLTRWHALAGADFETVMALQIPRATTLDQIDRAGLRRLIALEDRGAAQKLAALTPTLRDRALDLPPVTLRRLSDRFTGAQTATLFSALEPINEPAKREVYVERLIEKPARLQGLTGGGARAVRWSSEPETALDILLDDRALWHPLAIAASGSAVIEGQVSPLVLPQRYGWWLLLLLLPAMMVLGMLRSIMRLFWRPRPREVVRVVEVVREVPAQPKAAANNPETSA
ncbi:MAG: hypothetical protein MRY63_04255 [Neomegalonema sp.]|nr:hypothetical protein [Neomegalonema sp.]